MVTAARWEGSGGVFLIAWRDLQFRRRRFFVSVLAVALVLSMTLVLAGLSNFFPAEVDRTLDDLGTDTWLVAEGSSGPFTGSTPLLGTRLDEIVDLDGVDEAGPLAFRQLKLDDEDRSTVNVFGVDWDAVGAPEPDEGRGVEREGEVVADASAGYEVGEQLSIAGQPATVVGTVEGSTVLVGTPNLFFGLEEAQQRAFAGQPILNAVAVSGSVAEPPTGMVVVDRSAARDDLLAPLEDAAGTILMVTVLLWIVAACIIGSVIYLSALERTGDFAVLKATGTSSSWVLGSLLIQAVLLAVVSSVVALALSLVLAPQTPMPAEIPTSAYIALPLTAVVVSLLASLAGVRRAVTVDPALAFG